MAKPHYEQAQRYALRRLEHELPPTLRYHDLWHTRDDILAAVKRLAEAEGIPEADRRLLEVAACYHDIGFLEQIDGHEEAGVRIAENILPQFGFEPAQIALIAGMIRATRLPQSPQTPLEAILADADLYILGQNDFLARNQLLRQEMALLGRVMTDFEWHSSQIKFIEDHRYFTESANTLCHDGKERNLALLRAALRQSAT